MKNIDIQAELAIIDAANISELKEMFRQEFGFDIQISNAETIKRRLQYRVQENICGGLTDEEIATLDRIADEEERNERKSGKALKAFLPGTRLVGNTKGITTKSRSAKPVLLSMAATHTVPSLP